MLATTLAGLALLQAEPQIDNRFMTIARYPAASRQQDLDAPGGHGSSENYPKQYWFAAKTLVADLKKSASGLNLTIYNGSKETAWLQAADGNLMGYLIAKDPGGTWKPLQYHPWYTCGNSYHHVALPQAHGWVYQIPMPTGTVKTKVRWILKMGKTELKSNDLDISIPATKFQLPPSLAKAHKLKDWGSYVALVPAGMSL